MRRLPVVLALFLLACGDDDSTPPVADAATGEDAPQSSFDADPLAPDAPPGAPDAPASDAATVDGPTGPTVDAPASVDAVVGIPCGSEVCISTTEQCCVTAGPTYACLGVAETCGGATVACDGPEDCGAGRVCCAQLSGGSATVSCQPSANCTGTSVTLCHVQTDCSGTAPCCPPSATVPYSYCSPLGMCF